MSLLNALLTGLGVQGADYGECGMCETRRIRHPDKSVCPPCREIQDGREQVKALLEEIDHEAPKRESTR